MKTAITVLLVSLLSNIAFAHEGHDKTPGAVAAPHGGVVQGTNQIYLELVTEADGVKIYPFTHDLKPIPTGDLKVEGAMTLPKKSKSEKIAFSGADDAFFAKIDAKGAHRYTLDVVADYKGKKEKAKFNVEPK